VDALKRLTRREKQVHDMAVQGAPIKDMARTLGVRPRTVKYHLGNIYRKLGVANRLELMAKVNDTQ